jgi:hypothetical protein
VYELAVDENKMVPTVLPAESDTLLLPAPKLLNWIMLLEEAVVSPDGATPFVQLVAVV